jgi:hypothetical protein
MKKSLLLFSCLLFAVATFANTIDSLKTDNDVFNFLNITIKKQKIYFSKVTGVNSWQKLDFNNDNNADLFVQALDSYHHPTYLIAIDIGQNEFKLIHFGIREDGKILDIIKYNDIPLIVFNSGYYPAIYSKGNFSRLKKENRTDTLIYKYGNFVEFNENPDNYKIDSITFSSLWGWHGRDNTPPKNTNPDQNLEISSNRKAIYTSNRNSATYVFTKGVKRPPRHPKTDLGTFKGKIKKADLEDIYDLINYLSIKKLNDRYAIQATDLTSCYVHIKFKDGSTKFIADYGGEGTFGLKSLYAKLFALRDSQDWK